MRSHAYPISVVSIVAVTLAASAPAAAGDAVFCVSCTGPDQTYLCKVTGAGMGRADALKLYCIVNTAKEGGHASCSARNEVTGCIGATKIYAYEGPSLPADPNQAEPLQAGVDEAFDQQAADEEASPTLFRATGRAYSASRRGIRNVRSRFDGEDEQADLPSGALSSLPASAAQEGSLPELPGAEPSPLTPLPTAMAPAASTEPSSMPAAAPTIDAAPADESPGRIRRSAQGVGKFAKKSYRCVRTLFRRCTEAEASAPY